jgi:hypothetical protein
VQVPLWNTLLVDLKWNMGVPVRETAFYPYPYLYPYLYPYPYP